MQLTRLLGFAPLAGADALHARLRAVPGPDPRLVAGPDIVAVVQAEADTSLAARDRDTLIASLRSVQARLEAACANGPFLPMDPSAACCPVDALPAMLEVAWTRLSQALTRFGSRHQWDIALAWKPEPVLSQHRAEIAPMAVRGKEALAQAVGAVLRADCQRREAALLAVLAPVVLAFADGGPACSDTQIVVTVLVASRGEAPDEAAVEAALDGLAPEHVAGASIDMRGPLPPLSFSPVRVATVDEQAIIDAWDRLDLPEQVDTSTLHRQWRLLAAAAHPDRPADPGTLGYGVTVSDLTAAYRLLRDLLPPATPGPQTLRQLLQRTGPRLVVPACVPERQDVPGHTSDAVLETLS